MNPKPVLLDRTDLLAAVLEAQQRSATFGTGSGLELSAQKLADVARAGGFQVLLGASPVADRLIGACVVLTRGLEAFDPHSGGVSRVLVVDAACAGPLSVARAAKQAHRLGVDHVGAAIFDATFSAGYIEGIDELSFIEISTQDRPVRETATALTA